MLEITKYVASDGKEFLSKRECELYELDSQPWQVGDLCLLSGEIHRVECISYSGGTIHLQDLDGQRFPIPNVGKNIFRITFQRLKIAKAFQTFISLYGESMSTDILRLEAMKTEEIPEEIMEDCFD